MVFLALAAAFAPATTAGVALGGTVILELQTLPDGDGTAFVLNTSSLGAPEADLSDGQTFVASVATLDGLGEYSVDQLAPPPGYGLADLRCSDEAGLTPSVPDLANRTVLVRVSEGETVTCVFTNARNGAIVIQKETLPEGAPGLFTFTGAVAGAIADGGSLNRTGLLPGAYGVAEAVSADYDLAAIDCDDSLSAAPSSGDVDQRTATILVDAGETVTCTFTNVQRATLTLEKQTLPDGADASFRFEGSAVQFALDEGRIADGDRFLSDGDELVLRLPPGGYSVAEPDPGPGADLSSIECRGEGAAATDPQLGVADLDLGPGDAMRCVFTNTLRARITVEKIAADEAFGVFVFTTTGTGYESFFLVPGASNTQLVRPGEYSLAESAAPEGWNLAFSVCSGGAFPAPTVYTSATFSVEAGDEVVCRFYNDFTPAPANGTLTIQKQVVNDDGGTLEDSDAVVRIDGLQVPVGTPVGLAAGFHLVTEDPVPGYATSYGDSDCDGFGVVYVAAEGAAQCIVINDDIRPRLLVKKHVVNDGDGTNTAADFILRVLGSDGNTTNVTGDEDGVEVGIPAGAYIVTEDAVAGYTATFSTQCLGIAAPGDVLVCTITNDDGVTATGGGGGGGGGGSVPSASSSGTPTASGPGGTVLGGSAPQDTDGDGYPDLVEVVAGSDPRDATDRPNFDLSTDLTVEWTDAGAVLHWLAPRGGAAGFLVWRSTSPFALVATLDGSSQSFTDANAPPNAKYKVTYFVEKTAEGGYSPSDPAAVSGWNAGEHTAARSDGAGPAAPMPGSEAGLPGWVTMTVVLVALLAVLLAVAWSLDAVPKIRSLAIVQRFWPSKEDSAPAEEPLEPLVDAPSEEDRMPSRLPLSSSMGLPRAADGWPAAADEADAEPIQAADVPPATRPAPIELRGNDLFITGMRPPSMPRSDRIDQPAERPAAHVTPQPALMPGPEPAPADRPAAPKRRSASFSIRAWPPPDDDES